MDNGLNNISTGLNNINIGSGTGYIDTWDTTDHQTISHIAILENEISELKTQNRILTNEVDTLTSTIYILKDQFTSLKHRFSEIIDSFATNTQYETIANIKKWLES